MKGLFCLSAVIVAGEASEGRKGERLLMALRQSARICKHDARGQDDRLTVTDWRIDGLAGLGKLNLETSKKDGGTSEGETKCRCQHRQS